jgi:hypothetical protein
VFNPGNFHPSPFRGGGGLHNSWRNLGHTQKGKENWANAKKKKEQGKIKGKMQVGG